MDSFRHLVRDFTLDLLRTELFGSELWMLVLGALVVGLAVMVRLWQGSDGAWSFAANGDRDADGGGDCGE